jgi:hypothetical protein
VQATVLPRPYDLVVQPLAAVGTTPMVRLGATLRLAARLH